MENEDLERQHPMNLPNSQTQSIYNYKLAPFSSYQDTDVEQQWQTILKYFVQQLMGAR